MTASIRLKLFDMRLTLGTANTPSGENRQGNVSQDQRESINAEASRLQESATYSAQGQFEAGKTWRAWNWVLGGFTGAASGVSGVLTFAADGLQIVSGSLALAAAVTAAVHTTVKPDKKAEAAESSGNEYLAIQSAARRFQTIDVPAGEIHDLRPILEELASRSERANKSSNSIPKFAYGRAQKNIKQGGQSYAVDGS